MKDDASETVDRIPRPAVFLDRDGIITIDRGYVHHPDDLVLTPTAAEAIRLINAAHAWAIVVTNQSGVARGMFGLADVALFHAALDKTLAAEGAKIDAYYVAPYHPDGSVARYAIDHPDRKPGSGLLRRAFRDFPIDRSRSILFGDRESDAKAAEGAGIVAQLLPKDHCDLAGAVSLWLESHADTGRAVSGRAGKGA